MGFWGRMINLGRGVARGVGRSSQDKAAQAALQAELARELRARPTPVVDTPPGVASSPALDQLKRDFDQGRLSEAEYLLKRAAVLEGRDPDAVDASDEIRRTL